MYPHHHNGWPGQEKYFVFGGKGFGGLRLAAIFTTNLCMLIFPSGHRLPRPIIPPLIRQKSLAKQKKAPLNRLSVRRIIVLTLPQLFRRIPALENCRQ